MSKSIRKKCGELKDIKLTQTRCQKGYIADQTSSKVAFLLATCYTTFFLGIINFLNVKIISVGFLVSMIGKKKISRFLCLVPIGSPKKKGRMLKFLSL
jgi:hypothetical protein